MSEVKMTVDMSNDVTPAEIVSCLYNADIYSALADRLSAYNVNRGGKNYFGFVFEELAAADAAGKGVDIHVLNNNGPADLLVKDASGREIYVQAKAGYNKPHRIDWSKYEGQTILVDNGNTTLAEEARAAGLSVQESAISKKEAQIVANAQKMEHGITGKSSAPVVGTMTGAHYAGLANAKLAARIGVSMKLGESIYDMVSGEKDFAEAAADVVVDGAVLTGGAYLGAAALTVAETAAGAAAAAVAETAVGAAVTSAAASAAAAVGSTAVGSAVLAGAGSVAAAAASTVAAVASAPLLPVIGAGALLGFVGKGIMSLFD